MSYELTENAVAFFIVYATGKVDAFDTVAERDAVVAEIDADNAAFLAA